MITLQPISEENFIDVLELKASEDLVAPNYESLAEAYISLREAVEEDELQFAEMPFAILHDETIVGFAMVCLEDGEDLNVGSEIYWLSRLMIDDKYQGKGYGKAAMTALIDFVKSKPHEHNVKYFYTSVVPSSHIATKLYERMGFEKTDQVLGGEDVMQLVL